MHFGTVVHVFTAIVVLLQAPTNVDSLVEFGSQSSKVDALIKGHFSSPFTLWQNMNAPPVTSYEGCILCPWGTCRPVIKPPDEVVDLATDVEDLADALTRMRPIVNKDDLSDILITRTEVQRSAIAAAYQAKSGVQLRAKIQDRLGSMSRFQLLMKALSTPLPAFFARQFYYALHQQEEKEEEKRAQSRTLLVEMFSSLSRCLIVQIIEAYNSEFKSDFFNDINTYLKIAQMPSEYIDAIQNLAKAKWDHVGLASWASASLDAYKLKQAVELKPIHEVKERYSELFTKKSLSHIVKTMYVYDKLKSERGAFLKDISRRELGKVDEIYILMTRILIDKPLYFATQIEKILHKRDMFSLSSETEFVVLLRGRIGIDLQDIIDTYNRISKTGLVKDFESWDGSFPLQQRFRDSVLMIIT